MSCESALGPLFDRDHIAVEEYLGAWRSHDSASMDETDGPRRYDVPWNFGALTFKNVKIVATGSSSSSWCTSSPSNYNGATKYTITGAKASVSGTTVTCTIDSVVLQGPA